jgi:hypothetical protein
VTTATSITTEETASNVQLEILRRVGIPFVKEIKTAPKLAVELLKLAAEVEHALMVQYLYSASSVVNAAGVQEDYHRKLLNVAKQEMGHLATVQNLLLLLGGPAAIHLQRDPYRDKLSKKNPLPFVLEPASRAALAKDVVAEMPAPIPRELRSKVAELVKLANEAAGVEVNRVGTIYATLKWMFLPAGDRQWDLAPPLPKDPITDQDLRPSSEVTAFEAKPEEWQPDVDGFILETPHTCKEAVAAIDKIAAQGEGFENPAGSHFGTFLELVDALDASKFTAKALATSPTLGGGNGGEGGQEIASQYTRHWGSVFSLQYSMLVLTIYHALRTQHSQDGTPGLRPSLVDLVKLGMKKIIRPVSGVCASLPMRDGSPELAGPPYDLDPAVLRISDETELATRHLRLLDDLAVQYVAIEKSPEFRSHPTHKNELDNLRSFDKRRRDLLTPHPPNL